MTHSIVLEVLIGRAVLRLTSGCIFFRLEKERYTPYTELSGQWYCPKNTSISEAISITLKIDNVIRHKGYPTETRIIKKDGRVIIDVKSRGYTSLLMTNQCPDGLTTDVNLQSLVSQVATFPNVTYQSGTPTVNYVYYYNGTSMWDGIVCYAIRAVEQYPYIYNHNTVRISAPDTVGSHTLTTGQLISKSYDSDFSRILSKITMKDIDGTENAYGVANTAATRRSIVRMKELNFDKEWIQDPQKGVSFKMNYSMRKISVDCFSFPGYSDIELLDTFSLSDANYSHEIDRMRLEGSAEKGFVTTVWCYHDGFCSP